MADNIPSRQNPAHRNLEGVSGRPATPEEIAQRDGYVRGRSDENYLQGNLREQERLVAPVQTDDSAANGMVLGIIIALLAAGVGAAVYFLSGDRTAPVAAPVIERPTVTERETTIIERDNPVPAVTVPDVQVPEVQVPDVQVEVPDINITNEGPAEPVETPTTEPIPAEAAPEAAPEATSEPPAN